ncbi:Carbonyl reductase family member 4 [Neolecta irregularis DAH-3]|uniref:Carbonyl reductase family member 4 n=1 Tax=Neolecta irregularis (strain DAH-3) TaxID=1198029 RepID=A0A1U7LGB3_NEOID|nr:Carbonyl reductase family member 4 [Neolecta irregularis DAH-3]|eukprot:OLL21695.1 Carbonyl reductase family member 4 [Neolecta irregularis DAH-3]
MLPCRSRIDSAITYYESTFVLQAKALVLNNSLLEEQARNPTLVNKRSFSKLQNKVCLITGGSRGIGAAIAQRFAQEGLKCILVSRSMVELQKSCAGLPGLDHKARFGDVGERKFWVELGKEFKDVDILVNSAGIGQQTLLVRTSEEEIDQIIRTNLIGTVYGCQIIGKNMLKNKTGSIINISSILGLRGSSGCAIYSASKAVSKTSGFTKALAQEFGPSGIRVNGIAPGYIDTDMIAGFSEAMRSSSALKRPGTVSEVAEAAFMVATNTYINGSTITIDGGLSFY